MLRKLIFTLFLFPQILVAPVAWGLTDQLGSELQAKYCKHMPKGLRIEVKRAQLRHENIKGIVPDDRCDNVNVIAFEVDLNKDGFAEWVVNDIGFSGTGASLSFIFGESKSTWHQIGKTDEMDLTRVSSERVLGYSVLAGYPVGKFVCGSSRAVWNGDRYLAKNTITRWKESSGESCE